MAEQKNDLSSLAKKDHRIVGSFRDPKTNEEEKFDITIVKGKTKLSDIPARFLPTVKAEGIF